jgi:hypothetical protein
MAPKPKKEGSSMGGGMVKGFLGPLGGSEYDPEKPKKQHISSELFEDLIAFAEARGENLPETVKKRGENWVVYDDKTGVEKGTYAKRADAWKFQRQSRLQKKNSTKQKSKKKIGKVKLSKKSELAPGAKVAHGAFTAPKAKTESKETFKKMLMKNLTQVLQESALHYVFEQSPLSKESQEWDSFLQKLSKQTVMSDPKLKQILHDVAKSEVGTLAKAVQEIKNYLEQTGKFQVEQKKADQDEMGDLMLNFDVGVLETGKKYTFSVKIDGNKPLIKFSDEVKNQLNANLDDETKYLRANLMYCQETILDEMNDLSISTEKRDDYLSSIQASLDEILSKMEPLQLVMLRSLVKSKYKEIK